MCIPPICGAFSEGCTSGCRSQLWTKCASNLACSESETPQKCRQRAEVWWCSMNEIDRSTGLFPMDEGQPGNIFEYPTKDTGVLPYQGLRNMVREGQIVSHVPITPDQFQPASIDLRLGRRAWRVRASFLPGSDATVMDRVKELDDLPEIDLSEGAVFE